VVLEGVNNPDNVGGIFRSAAAFGTDLLVLGPDCGDPLYRKAIRTSMGGVFEVPYAVSGNWPDALDLIRSAGFRLVALTPRDPASRLGDLAAGISRVALVAGAEGHGVSAAALDRVDVRVSIPMTARVSSLNVATAVSIALHHLYDV
jgi:tRNA G18 (ribose-2'-O)-methylase SpoU